MRIVYDNIVLRDMIESDIEEYVRWFTVEREWENWDAPWEEKETTEETERQKRTEYFGTVKQIHVFGIFPPTRNVPGHRLVNGRTNELVLSWSQTT